MDRIKAVIVGSDFSGKTLFILRTCGKPLPEVYQFTIFENYDQDMIVDGKTVRVYFWDTGKS